MFVVIFEATPNRESHDFQKMSFARVTAYINAVSGDDAMEIASALTSDAQWSITSVKSVSWINREEAERSPRALENYEAALLDGPTMDCEYFPHGSQHPFPVN